jgi:hypothetical protein
MELRDKFAAAARKINTTKIDWSERYVYGRWNGERMTTAEQIKCITN